MSNNIGLGELGYDERLYVLAFDHRGSFEKMVGDIDRVPGAKTLIWEGFQKAVELGAPKEFSGVLVDAQYGSNVAREAKAGGYKLAMPVEKSGQMEFDFDYGDAFGEKIEEYDPDFTKVLVRYNPDGDAAMNARQIEKLRRLSEWLHEHHRKYLFELLVPAEAAQLEQVGGSTERYDVELRPELMMRGDPRAPGRRRRGRHLEDRGDRGPGGVQRDREARAPRGAGPRVVRRARPRRLRREGRRVAARRFRA